MALSPLFEAYFRVFALTLTAAQAFSMTVQFAGRCQERRVLLNLTGLASAFFSLLGSSYALHYAFQGLSSFVSCGSLKVVASVGLSLSNILAFSHLLIKADIANRDSDSWKKWRWIGGLLLVSNFVALVINSVKLQLVETETFAGKQCFFVVNNTATELYLTIELVHYVFLVTAFVMPLRSHIHVMESSGTTTSTSILLYQSLVNRAFCASVFAIVGFLVNLILIFSFHHNPALRVPAVGLEIFDNFLILYSVSWALRVPTTKCESESSIPRNETVNRGSISIRTRENGVGRSTIWKAAAASIVPSPEVAVPQT